MTDEIKILNSKDSIAANTAPTGVVYGAFRLTEAPLWEVFAVRVDEEGKEHPDKVRKQPVEGSFTSDVKALEALRKYLSLRWAESDEAQAKLDKRKAA